ncbi:MAG: AAA family ATPase [Duncaniella sp.]|nr:AAA family ATPase [Duncaniella sp.]MDE5919818.1 AAA family ATPase [Duncaniella sp.]MDE6328720.1 AAA family ATPase [Duncaniella sp.]MDE6466319.1 AAA family ATPase [Duncaniella sp.]
MTVDEFAASVTANLPYSPNKQQELLIGALSRFCSSASPSDSVFIINGYAGTGKTSLTGALVKSLVSVRRPVVLLAPTGRAAKVFSAHAGHPAYTIHRKIYRGPTGDLTGGNTMMQRNTLSNAVFIVDEASMIGDSTSEGNTSLLEDLVEYVFTGDNCRLILIGDVAQLPPVGSTDSPAMSAATFKRLGLHVSRATITDTARQAADSGILRNATWLRRAMLVDPLPTPRLVTDGYDDVHAIEGDDVVDVIGECYRADGAGETIVVTRSNKRATAFNLGIRTRILDLEEELCKGERLLVAKNNYMWSAKIKELDFIANGDVGVVTAIHSVEERYGFRFANITLNLPDRDTDVECRIFLDTLTDESSSIDREKMQQLAEACMADPERNSPDLSWEQRLRRLRTDPYFNALQVKYAYAVTCHKAQGAQWANVVVDLGGIAPESRGLDFYRWLYTATSRATRRLFFLNPGEMAE